MAKLFKNSKDRKFRQKLLKLAVGSSSPSQLKRGMTERKLIAEESKIGRQLFGPIPKGHSREFFCLDERTWIWHEMWTDGRSGRSMECTTRYEVHPSCILKIQDGQPYREVRGQELYNLALATREYALRVADEVYHQPIPQAQ